MNRTFDRVPFFDERSLNYPVRTLVPDVPRSYTWRCDVVLDQGAEGACVGHAWAHEIAARPGVSEADSALAFRIYREAQKVDEWPGEGYSGTSVIAGAKVATGFGYYDEYRWAFGVEDLALAVGHRGPAVLGINWYDGMVRPGGDGYIHPTGRVLGGHAILCRGVNFRLERFLLHNSWGSGWGSYGTCFVTFDDMARLLAEDGEACIPVLRRRR